MLLRIIVVYLVLTNAMMPIIAQDGIKVLNKKMTIDISMSSSNELKIIIEESLDKKVLDVTKVKGYEVSESIYHEEEFESKPRIIAYTLLPDQGKKANKEKKVMVTNFPVEDYLDHGVFYSGTKRYLVNYPYVQDGAILHYESKILIKEPRLIPSFFFDHYLPCDLSELTVTVAKNVEIGILDFFRGLEDQITFTESTLSNDYKLYKWSGENFSPRRYEDAAGGISCTSPHTIVRIKSYTKGNEKVRVLEDENDLFSWYSSLVSDQVLDSKYSTIVDSLKASSNESLQVAENIFNWVQHNVKYIAYEDGFGGFIPRDPNSVINNRYGDCKDMAMLTKTLMNACGLECHIAWVGTRNKCYTYNSCPTPVTDDHMIAAFPLGDQFLFLDPTSAYSEFGKPSAFIQGKEAMVRKSAVEFEVILIEEIDAAENYNVDSLVLEISENDLKGSGTNRLGGYEKIEFEYALDYSSVTSDMLFAKFLSLGNESFKVFELNQVNTDSNKGEIHSTFNFELKNHLHQFDNNIIVEPFIKSIPIERIGNRFYNLNIPYKSMYKSTVQLKLPEGYIVQRLPESVSIDENGLRFEIVVKQTEEFVEISHSFYCDVLNVSFEQFEPMNSTLKLINKKLKQSIELKNEKV